MDVLADARAISDRCEDGSAEVRTWAREADPVHAWHVVAGTEERSELCSNRGSEVALHEFDRSVRGA